MRLSITFKRRVLLTARAAAAVILAVVVLAGALTPPVLLASEDAVTTSDTAAIETDAGAADVSAAHNTATTDSPPGEPAAAVAGVLTLSDDFENPFGGLFLRMNASRGSVHAVQGYEAGEYVMRKSDPRTSAPGVVEELPGTYRDTALTADVRLVGETAGRFADLSCRLNMEETAGYTVELRPHDRSFRVLRRDPARATPTVLVDWRSSDAINGGTASNRIGLSCAGGTITVLSNGATLAAVADTTFSSGRLAIAVGADRATGITWEARWDNLLLVAS